MKKLTKKCRPPMPSIADIANDCSIPNYWARKTMKFFNQRRSDFKVSRTKDPKIFKTSAPSYWDGSLMGYSTAYWKKTNKVAAWEKVDYDEEVES